MKKKKVLLNSFLVVTFASIFYFNTTDVYAASVVESYNYNYNLQPVSGERVEYPMYGQTANYVKVVVNTSGGDNYDVQFVTNNSSLSARRILAEKRGISAGGKSTTIYFIPPKGSCPGSNCITVAAQSGYTTDNNVVGASGRVYGIQFKNGSFLGGNLNVSGSVQFLDY